MVVDAIVNVAVDVVADAMVTTRIGETIIGIGIETMTEMVFKRGEMLGCDISVVRGMYGMTPIVLDLMPLGSMILEILPCLITMIIGNCQGRLLVLQLALYPLRKVEWVLNPNSVWLFLK